MAKGKTNYPPGGVDTSDANAVAADILNSKTAYGSAGTKITGTMPTKVGSSTVITPSTSDQTIPQGYYGGAAGDGKVLGDADLVAGNIKTGVNIFGVTGTMDSAPSSLETETNVYSAGSSVNVNIYYRKFGKLYVFGSPKYDGYESTSRFKDNATTIAKVCSVLGITESTHYSTRVNLSGTYNIYWNGTNWGNDNSTTKLLIAILAA